LVLPRLGKEEKVYRALALLGAFVVGMTFGAWVMLDLDNTVSAIEP